MRESAWGDWMEPSYVPDHSLPLFGADVVHTPERERTRTRWDEPPALNCPRCGGATVDARGHVVPNRLPAPILDSDGTVLGYRQTDPVRVCADHVTHRGEARLDELPLICGLCHRSLYDLTPALARAIKTGPTSPVRTADPTPVLAAPAHLAPAPAPATLLPARVPGGSGSKKRAARAARMKALGLDRR
jgi:hypothetical protein